jgi:hypothetical protein
VGLSKGSGEAYGVNFGDKGLLLGIEDRQLVVLLSKLYRVGQNTPIVESFEFSAQGVEEVSGTDQQLSEPSRHGFVRAERGILWECIEFREMGGRIGSCVWPQHGDSPVGHGFDPFGADGPISSNRDGERGVMVVVLDVSFWRFAKGLSDTGHFVLQIADPLLEYILLDGSFFFALLDCADKVNNDLTSLID